MTGKASATWNKFCISIQIVPAVFDPSCLVPLSRHLAGHLQQVMVESMKPVKVTLQKAWLDVMLWNCCYNRRCDWGSVEGQGCAYPAVNTWQGQNPLGEAGALPNIATVLAGTMWSCQKIRLLSVHHTTAAALQTTEAYIYYSAITFQCGIVRQFYKIPSGKAASTPDAHLPPATVSVT